MREDASPPHTHNDSSNSSRTFGSSRNLNTPSDPDYARGGAEQSNATRLSRLGDDAYKEGDRTDDQDSWGSFGMSISGRHRLAGSSRRHAP